MVNDIGKIISKVVFMGYLALLRLVIVGNDYSKVDCENGAVSIATSLTCTGKMITRI